MTIDWNNTLEEAVGYLQQLLRINTINPPGNEIEACRYLADILGREGIEATILESIPTRGNLIARIKGNGNAAPLLLMVHLDVVAVEPEHWRFPPFSGEIADGYLYGRGALDTKQLAAMELMIMLLIKREGVRLNRDIIFMANADEEVGGHNGAGWVVKQHPELIRAEYAINEGGGFGTNILGRRVFTVQTGEKGTARFTLRARGRPGHGSVPTRDNSVLKLAEGIRKLADANLPMHLVPTARLYIEGLANAVGGREAGMLRALLDGKNGSRTLDKIPLDEGLRGMLYAMLHNTATPTQLRAGQKINVIPSSAEAGADGRILPGQSRESFLQELRTVLPMEYEIEFHEPTTTGIEADPQSPLLDTISRVLKRHEPEAVLLPELVVGGTDARHVTKLGTKVYGFCPMYDNAVEMERVHGHDERIKLQNVGFGTRVLYEVVTEFAGAG